MDEQQKLDRIAELEDELKVRDRRVAELRSEIDEVEHSRQRLREACEEMVALTESWCEAFGMEMTAEGKWTWKPFWNEHAKLVNDYNALVRDWNKHIAFARPGRNVGRPLAASDAQAREVLKLRPMSLRAIAEETSLSLATVRTIIGQAKQTDRTTRKHFERIKLDKVQATTWKRQRRTGDALPTRINAALTESRAAVKEARS
jgi:hypothetical protein